MLARVLALALLAASALPAQSPDDSVLRWRPIGPHRGGRTKAAVGVPQRPNTFYIGAVNGGVWRSDDVGRSWTPIFDAQPTGSVGAIAVAPSNPDVLYVGSGEGMQRPDLSVGDGIYRSADGGRTWTHLGLRDAQQIPQIAVDPTDPDRLFVAALGHPYGPNAERGVFRSTDGGRSFQRVLFRDANTGAADVVLDPADPRTVYAVLWESRQAPWENGVFTGPGSGVWRSTDGGDTWTPIGRGLPTFAEGLGRVGLGVAPSKAGRLFATVESRERAGLYRSDDRGDTWTLVNADPRVTMRGADMAEVKVDPRDADVVYTASIVTWKSTDGGRTFAAFRGAPGGDDYQRIWIDPQRPDVILLASDQGAVVTTNGGRTWSSWYNQPTAQFYHVSTDAAFPYRVCGGQQESGSACVRSRGDWGQITVRDWSPVGVEEYGYVAPDPRDPDVVYGGKVSRWDRRTGQVQDVAPVLFRSRDYRVLRTAPVLFSPRDSTTLYFASNVVWKTTDGARRWTRISPDLTRRDSVVPAPVGTYAASPAATARHPGVVYALGPSPLTTNVLWAGTDDGLLHVTLDGGASWRDVTPPALGPWMKVSIVEASPFDSLAAYAAINTLRLDDLRAHVLRTRDGGRTWVDVGRGLPDGPVNVVRADPARRGLLYAGTERQVWVSVDDGDTWRSLRLNMPATSIRDLVVKDADVVVGTHGRGFWILDDASPLRQWDAAPRAGAPVLLRPALATRVRDNLNTDTPLPPDEPTMPNPPDGAVLDYRLPAAARRVAIEVVDSAGAVFRTLASDDAPEPLVPDRNIPDWWIRPSVRPGTGAGAHRVVWDLRGPTPAASRFAYPIAAVPGRTPREPRGPWVLPGRYAVRLRVTDAAGRERVVEQPLVVRMDPRVRTSAADLARLHGHAVALAAALGRAAAAEAAARAQGGPGAPALAAAARLRDELTTLYDRVTEADAPPTAALEAAIADRLAAAERLPR